MGPNNSIYFIIAAVVIVLLIIAISRAKRKPVISDQLEYMRYPDKDFDEDAEENNYSEADVDFLANFAGHRQAYWLLKPQWFWCFTFFPLMYTSMLFEHIYKKRSYNAAPGFFLTLATILKYCSYILIFPIFIYRKINKDYWMDPDGSLMLGEYGVVGDGKASIMRQRKFYEMRSAARVKNIWIIVLTVVAFLGGLLLTSLFSLSDLIVTILGIAVTSLCCISLLLCLWRTNWFLERKFRRWLESSEARNITVPTATPRKPAEPSSVFTPNPAPRAPAPSLYQRMKERADSGDRNAQYDFAKQLQKDNCGRPAPKGMEELVSYTNEITQYYELAARQGIDQAKVDIAYTYLGLADAYSQAGNKAMFNKCAEVGLQWLEMAIATGKYDDYIEELENFKRNIAQINRELR